MMTFAIAGGNSPTVTNVRAVGKSLFQQERHGIAPSWLRK